MASSEPRDVDEEKQQRLEDLLTTIPLLKPSSSVVAPLEVTLVVGNKPNAIVRPFPRAVAVKDTPLPPVHNASLAALEAQIQPRPSHENHNPHPYSGYAESKRHGPFTTTSVTVLPKRKLVPMDPVLQKPLFITTVPSGVFLEKSLLAEPRKVYNYSSAPRVLRGSTLNVETQSYMAKVSSSCLTTKKSSITSSSEFKRGFR